MVAGQQFHSAIVPAAYYDHGHPHRHDSQGAQACSQQFRSRTTPAAREGGFRPESGQDNTQTIGSHTRQRSLNFARSCSAQFKCRNSKDLLTVRTTSPQSCCTSSLIVNSTR
jgi:hypothetical protein